MKANILAKRESSELVDGTAQRSIVVIGNGMVGFRFLLRLTELASPETFKITVFGAEPRPAYDRVHLTRFFAGTRSEELELGSSDWYRERKIALYTNDPIIDIQPGTQSVVSQSGKRTEYDQLVIATGSRAFVPPISGTENNGVFVYRTIEDLEAIQAYAKHCRRAAVLGGGLLGIEAADALKKLGLETHIVERNTGLMSHQLPPEGSEILEREIIQKGFHIHLNKNTSAIDDKDGTRILRFQNGEALVVDMVVIASGIRPCDELGVSASITVHPRGGFEIDDTLETSINSVFAIGECANHRGTLYGLVGPGYKMADTLARRFTGSKETFEGDFLAARLKLLNVDVATFGDHQGDGQYLQKKEPKTFRRIVIRNNRLIGATIVGKCSQQDRIQAAVDSRQRIFQWNRTRFNRTGRLWNEQASTNIQDWPETALICNCLSIRRRVLSDAIHCNGCKNIDELIATTGASTVCGSCRPLLSSLLGAPSAPLPTKGYLGLGIAAIVSVGLILFYCLSSPIPNPSSVKTPSLSFLWTETFWKFTTGYTLVGLCLLSLLLSLRKRTPRFSLGNYGLWRAGHSLIGASTLVILITHTGLRLGENLNFVLLLDFLGLAAIGALASLFTSMEARLPSLWARRLRAASTTMHILLFWPLPILVFFHAFKAYYY